MDESVPTRAATKTSSLRYLALADPRPYIERPLQGTSDGDNTDFLPARSRRRRSLPLHLRSRWVMPIALLSGFAAALPTAFTDVAAAAPAEPAVVRVSQRLTPLASSGPVTLPTGEQVRLSGKSGQQRVVISHRATTGPGRSMLTRQLRGHAYVMPAVAEPYLGRFLDPSLFDATALTQSRSANGRLGVRISYRGKTPAVPGVRITSASGGVAKGYLTTGSSTAFGRALSSQWRTDEAAGWPHRTTLFAGVTRISSESGGPGQVTPKFPMLTLIIRGLGADGKPQQEGSLSVINVDDGRKYAGFAFTENGEARISVPAGHYSLLGDDFRYDEATDTASIAITTVNEVNVTKANQVVTLDHRKATVRPGVRVPKATSQTSYGLEWNRFDAAGYGSIGSGYSFDSDSDVRVAPAAKPKIGKVSLIQSWALREPGTNTDPSYVYDLASIDDHIPASLRKTFAASDLGVISAAYYGDGPTRTGALLRYAVYPTTGLGGGTLEPLTRPSARTEYVGATGKPTWTDVALLNYDSFDDPGFVDGPTRTIPTGTYTTARWFRGPLAPAIPVQTSYPYCYGCRSGNTISVGMAPFTDSDLRHSGELFGAEDGLPVARFRFYRNTTLIADQDDSLGGLFAVPAGRATYRAVLDVDRRLNDPVQSTRTQTEFTFSSAKNVGPKLPSSWFCDGEGCRVLPIVQAQVALPTDLNGRLPAKKSTVTVTAAQAQLATKSSITSATLEYRPAGEGWTTVALKAAGGGKYRGSLDNSDLEGTFVDLRVSATDKAGSTFKQTILRAYRVAG
jgi:hypothetical protein